MTLKHPNHMYSLALSPDNQLLAVGGQNSDIYIWTIKDQKLIRSFSCPNQTNVAMEEDPDSKAVFDINWSCDGTVVAAGMEKNVVMLDMRKILSQSQEGTPAASGEAMKMKMNQKSGSNGQHLNGMNANQNSTNLKGIGKDENR